jgi:hypothetical protein
MTKLELLKVLPEIFPGFKIEEESKSKWYCTWYFNVYFPSHDNEVMIPNKYTIEFMEAYANIYLMVLELNKKTSIILNKMNELKSGKFDMLRDNKINKIVE